MVTVVVGADRAGEGNPLFVRVILQVNLEDPLLEEMDSESRANVV